MQLQQLNSKFGMEPMLYYYSNIGQKTYCKDVTEQFIVDAGNKFEAGIIRVCVHRRFKSVAA